MRSPSTAFACLALTVALVTVDAQSADAKIYYRTGTSTENGNGSTSITMTVPSGVAVGDLLIADVDAAGTGAITPPANWTQLINAAGFTTYSNVHYRVATAADVAGASYTWNLGSTRKAVGRMAAYVGVDASTIGTPATTGNSSGTTITFNSVTTPAANSLVVLGGVALNGSGTESLTPPGTATTRFNVATSGTGSQLRSYTGDFVKATAAATGNLTGTISPSNAWATAMFWLKPASGALAFDVAPDTGALPSITLNGQSQTTTSQMSNFAVDDTTGSGSGWNVTVAGDSGAGKSAVFKQYCTQAAGCGSDPLGYVTGGRTLPASSLKLSSTGASFSGANGTAPTLQCSAPCAVDAGAATKVASAAAGAGLGPWQTSGFGSSSLSLSTPTTLRASPANEVYRVDLLWSLNSGP
jgi:WxL domain surface cell wall-binding